MEKSERNRLKREYKAKSREAELERAKAEKNLEEQAWALLQHYLSRATQLELHIYADRSNYDCNRRGIEFVLDNSMLAEATATLIFWRLGADYYARHFADEIPDFQRSTDRLVWLIEQRVNESFYCNGNIMFNPALTCMPPGEYASIGPYKRSISKAMYRSFHGSAICPPDDSCFDDGLPINVANSLQAVFEDAPPSS